MEKECLGIFELWEKYCKNKNYRNLSTEGMFCSSLIRNYNECIFKKKYHYNK
jgi:hypothetical protein